MPRIFDCFTFFNELDLLELRLKTLESLIYRFVIVEADRTFTGRPKRLNFAENRERFRAFAAKISYVTVNDMPMADDAWQREFHQRNAIARGLGEAEEDDLILVSDVDEIPKPEMLTRSIPTAHRAITFFHMDQYRYLLNMRLTDRTVRSIGPRMVERRFFTSGQKLRDTRHVVSRSLPAPVEELLWRFQALRIHGTWLHRSLIPHSAWHFSWMGGMDARLLKLDSWAHTEANTPENRRRTMAELLRSCDAAPVPLSDLPLPVQANPEQWQNMLFRLEPISSSLIGVTSPPAVAGRAGE